MQFGNRIKSLRIKKGITQRKLADMINVSTVTIGNWEAGIKQPSMKAIIALATALGVTTDFLLGINIDFDLDSINLEPCEISLIKNYRTLDKHSKKIVEVICNLESKRSKAETHTIISQFNFKEPRQNRYIPKYIIPSAAGISAPIDGDDFEMILVDENTPKDADFVVRIQGDSMFPYIQDGDIVYVKKTYELRNGDVGIFCVDGAMFCKQYYVDANGTLNLVSANQELKHTNIKISPENSDMVKCCGKVLLTHPTPLPEYIKKELLTDIL